MNIDLINIWVYSKIQKHSPEIEPTFSRHPLKKIMLDYDTVPRACRGVCLCTIIVLLYVLLLCDFQNIVLVSLEEQTRLLNEALHKCVLYILESESNSQNGKFLEKIFGLTGYCCLACFESTSNYGTGHFNTGKFIL